MIRTLLLLSIALATMVHSPLYADAEEPLVKTDDGSFSTTPDKSGLEHWRIMLIRKLGSLVGKNRLLRDTSERLHWDQESCQMVGTGAAASVVGYYSNSVCTFLSVHGPLGPAACIGLLTGALKAITFEACSQLCVDHHLTDCRGGSRI